MYKLSLRKSIKPSPTILEHTDSQIQDDFLQQNRSVTTVVCVTPRATAYWVITQERLNSLLSVY